MKSIYVLNFLLNFSNLYRSNELINEETLVGKTQIDKNKDGHSKMISSHYALVMTDLQAISYQKLSSPMNTTKA